MKRGIRSIACAALLTLALANTATAACRQALALGLDVSSSVDPKEYDLQMGGLAFALLDADVQALLLSQPSAPVALAIFEWSSLGDQNLIVDWRMIETATDISDIATILQSRHYSVLTRSTALGQAIRYGGELLANAPNCWNLTLDISGDGKNNDGFEPAQAHSDDIFRTATINGLVIDADGAVLNQVTDYRPGDLSTYYLEEVIFGNGAFVQTALGFRDFQRAMQIKLLRELNISMSRLRVPTNSM